MKVIGGETLDSEFGNRQGRRLSPESDESDFRNFVGQAEPRLRRALVAAFGPERGLEATAEALAYAWEHWSSLRLYDNPIGYIYRVGRSRTRSRKVRFIFARPETPDHWAEPHLAGALLRLSESERVAVVVLYCTDMSRHEAASMIGVSEPALQKRAERGLAKLRRSLGVGSDD
jgi:DNA-directed RNA polymerase specialized sigma24 family protein